MKRYVAQAIKSAGQPKDRKRLMRQFRAWPQRRRAEARRRAFASWMKWIAERAAARARKAV